MRTLRVAVILACLTGCQAETEPTAPPLPPVEAVPVAAPAIDMHSSRNALDWAGTYEGLVACPDCAGIHTRLTLDRDGRFEWVARRLVRDVEPSVSEGRFDWEAGGNTIVLAVDGHQQRFAVGEGRVLLLDAGQTQPAWGRSDAILAQSDSGSRETRPGLAEMIEDHRWTLVDASNAAAQRLDTLFPEPERPFAFNFSDTRMHVEGGCNGLRGGYRIDAQGMLEVTASMSTMMACEAALMDADATISALLSEPLETIMIRGAEPRLVLLGSAGDSLVLKGTLTPEARFGAPVMMFLEVYEQLVTCERSVRSDGLCLSVRELTFDDQGIRTGTPSDWQEFNAEIEGYRHEHGIRNILRVKRFDPEAGPDSPSGPIYVLDLVVQSELVSD